MNIKYNFLGLLAVTLTWASGAVAAPAVNVGSNSVVVGSPTAVIAVNWDGEGTVNSGQFRITYNSDELTPVNVVASCNAPWFCSNNDPGVIRFVADQGSPLPDALVANITFDTSTAAINDYPLVVTNQLFVNSVPAEVPPSGTTNGVLSVNSGPQPGYASNPTPAAGVAVPDVIQNATDTTANVVISNSGAATSTLTGSCTETSDPDTVFSLSGDTSFSVLQGTTDTVVVTCDSAGQIGPHSGSMQCTHNGDGSGLPSPQNYALSCSITAGPQPAYTSSNPTANSPINLAVTEAGEPDPSQTLTITNSGAATTTLTGTCAMMGGGDPQITLTSAGGFSILQGAAGSMKTVSCDASVQGNYSGTLSCSHNGSSPATPVNYAVSCVVPEAGSAVFASNPAPGPIDMTPGDDVVAGDTDPTTQLTFFNNADPGDQVLDISCSLAGSGEIMVLPDYSGGTSISPQAQTSVDFTCDAGLAGAFTSTYTCLYQNGGVEAPVGDNQTEVVYDVSCDVRDPEAEVEISPAPGTPQTKSVPPGGSTSFLFNFTEVNDEGEDGILHDCFLDAGGQGFTISSPTFPTDVNSGTTVPVVVDFTDPTGADSWSDTLVCEYSDSNDDDTIVTWVLTVNLGGDAHFTVLKEFTDGNPGAVTVDLDCNTGLILDQSKIITEDGIGVTFVVTDFDAGELDCNVTERSVAGYSADFEASGDSANTDSGDDEDGCYYTEVAGGDENLCVVTNSPDEVDVVITKEWLYPGSADSTTVSDYFELVMICDDAYISGGGPIFPGEETLEAPAGIGGICGFSAAGLDFAQLVSNDAWCKFLSGEGNTVFTEKVTPHTWPGGECLAFEILIDQAVEVDNGCIGSEQDPFKLKVSAGSGDSCTITNTVFFEGIPTLSQYGMALLALLMLGMGFVAVRRIA